MPHKIFNSPPQENGFIFSNEIPVLKFQKRGALIFKTHFPHFVQVDGLPRLDPQVPVDQEDVTVCQFVLLVVEVDHGEQTAVAAVSDLRVDLVDDL